MSSTTETLIEAACDELCFQLGLILARINSPESGRIAETMFQLLSDKYLRLTTTLVSGHEKETKICEFVGAISAMIASKLGVTLTEDSLTYAIENILALIQCEALRRKNHLEYSWMNDIFTKDPKDSGYSKLTDSGKELAYQSILMAHNGRIQ
jgi:hypothetical protein